jgi:hypothetical protein
VRDCESLLASISLSFQDSLIEASDEDLELAREHFSEHDLSNFFDLTVLCFLPVMNATWSSAPGSASAAKQRELASAAMKGALVELYQVLYLAILDVEDPRCLFSLGRAFGNLGGVSLTANAAALAYLEEQGVDTKTGRENLTTLENGFEDLAERLFN